MHHQYSSMKREFKIDEVLAEEIQGEDNGYLDEKMSSEMQQQVKLNKLEELRRSRKNQLFVLDQQRKGSHSMMSNKL